MSIETNIGATPRTALQAFQDNACHLIPQVLVRSAQTGTHLGHLG